MNDEVKARLNQVWSQRFEKEFYAAEDFIMTQRKSLLESMKQESTVLTGGTGVSYAVVAAEADKIIELTLLKMQTEMQMRSD